MTLVLVLLLAGAAAGQVFTCDREVDLPNLRICGQTQAEFCAPAPAPIPPPPVTLASLMPPGAIFLLDSDTAPCPTGFTDVSATHANRYLAVDTSPGTAGTAPASLASHKATTSGSSVGAAGFGGGSPIYTQVRSADVAPFAAFRLCRRDD